MKPFHEFFSENPSLDDCKTYLQSIQEAGIFVITPAILNVFAECYTGRDAVSIIQWLMGPPYCLVMSDETSPLIKPTPLMSAARAQRTDMIHALVKCGANVNETAPLDTDGSYGYTALDYVMPKKEAVLSLLDLGARRFIATKKVPSYVGEFLAKKTRLRQICTLLLGLRFRSNLLPAGFEKRLLPVIAHLVWAQRFEI